MGIKIDVTKNVTSRLGLEPIKDATGQSYKFGGLVPVRLVKVHITEQTYQKGEFEGHTLKCLTFEFENFKYDEKEPDRFLTHTEKIIGTVKNENGQPVPRDGKDVGSNIEAMWARIKHIYDQCLHSPNYRDIASVPKADIVKYFDLPVEGTVEERIAKFDSFFEYVSKFANGDGDKLKPIWENADGSGITGWLKLLPSYPDGKWYNIPNFTGQGFFEAAKVINKVMLSAVLIKVKASETLELSSARRATAAAGSSALPTGGAGGLDENTLKQLRGE